MAQRKCRLFQVDTFTREKFCGNPAAVVLGAEQLSDDEMRLLARELAGTEIAFVLEADAPDHDIEIRFFSPRREVSFIGHATIAAHYVRAMVDGVPKARVRQKSGTAIVEVEVKGRKPDLRVAIHQGPASFGPVVPEERRGAVLDALGISSSSLHPACPMQVMSKWNSRLIIGLASPDTLNSLQPDMDALVALTPHVGADGFLVFAVKPGVTPVTTEARMFTPVVGVPEDAVSGNAHGMLGVYLLANGLLAADDGTAHFVGHQGRFVGRPGRIEVEVAASGKRASHVQVAGDAVIVYQAELEF
ncbi:MAG: PhzF family phenazine biosynthesis isomerase [Lysobacterales bacterium]|jgi:PhzF family phenazine biosynthesis protein|nr:MAG: PhzF family phenazine biosynthesis isomerase [Xanthomonadales bacterium]